MSPLHASRSWVNVKGALFRLPKKCKSHLESHYNDARLPLYCPVSNDAWASHQQFAGAVLSWSSLMIDGVTSNTGACACWCNGSLTNKKYYLFRQSQKHFITFLLMDSPKYYWLAVYVYIKREKEEVHVSFHTCMAHQQSFRLSESHCHHTYISWSSSHQKATFDHFFVPRMSFPKHPL